MARLPKNSVFCRRAGEMLFVQHRPELALAAIESITVLGALQASREVKVMDPRYADFDLENALGTIERLRGKVS